MLVFDTDKELMDYLFVHNEDRYGIAGWTEYDLRRWMSAYAENRGCVSLWFDEDNNIVKLSRCHGEHETSFLGAYFFGGDLTKFGCRSFIFYIWDIGWGELLIKKSCDRTDTHIWFIVPKKSRWKDYNGSKFCSIPKD